MNAGRLLKNAASVHGHRSALVFGEEATSYRRLDDTTDAIAAGLLKSGLQRSDRLILWMANNAAFPRILFGAFKAGLVVVPINARLAPAEVAHIAGDSAARAIAADTEFRGPAMQIAAAGRLFIDAMRPPEAVPRELPDARPEDPAWLFYTSGTTGRPKGATLTHRNLVAMTMNCLADIYSFQPEDVVLHVAPLSHGSGLYLMPAIARGSTNVISHHPSFQANQVFELIQRHQITAIAFVAPTMVLRMVTARETSPHDLGSLKCVIYGGAPMYVDHITRALQLFGPIWVQLYGQGETPMTGTYLRAVDHRLDHHDGIRRLASIGIPRTDVDLDIVDASGNSLGIGAIGEITIRSDTVMAGYWRNPTASAEALRHGWLHTGDLGYRDRDGYVFLVDRAKDMIISAGNNIYAREVEEALLTHPAVLETAVIGVPDPEWGESVHALVVLHPGSQATSDELIAHCRGQVASYKKPKSVQFLAELPKNAYGKVLKRELREPFWLGVDGRFVR